MTETKTSGPTTTGFYAMTELGIPYGVSIRGRLYQLSGGAPIPKEILGIQPYLGYYFQ